jgi:hypothetical protein
LDTRTELFWKRYSFLRIAFEEWNASSKKAFLRLCEIESFRAAIRKGFDMAFAFSESEADALEDTLLEASGLDVQDHFVFRHSLEEMARQSSLLLVRESQRRGSKPPEWMFSVIAELESERKSQPDGPMVPVLRIGESEKDFKRRMENYAEAVLASSVDRTGVPKLDARAVRWTLKHLRDGMSYADIADAEDGTGRMETTVKREIQKLMKELGISRGRGRKPTRNKMVTF